MGQNGWVKKNGFLDPRVVLNSFSGETILIYVIITNQLKL